MDHHDSLLSLAKVSGHYGLQHLGEEVVTQIFRVKNDSADGGMAARAVRLGEHQG